MKTINLFRWTLLLLPVAAGAHPGHAENGAGNPAEFAFWAIAAVLYLLLLLLVIRGRIRRERHKA